MWEIIDNDGTIHSGCQEEMETAWTYMVNDLDRLKEIYSDTNIDIIERTKKEWDFDWKGDLKLMEIHNLY